MLRFLFIILLSLLSLCPAWAAPAAPTAVGSPRAVPFTALHVYYMSPTGSDSNSGTSPSSPWATPNHRVECGDVIIAAPGDYAAWRDGLAVTSQPSNCPSTSGGINGVGGIYFATVLCGGDLGACYVDGSRSSGAVIDILASNWAFEGWQLSSKSIGRTGMRGFQVDASASGTTIIQHVAFVNDIVTHAQQAYDIDDAGKNHNVPGNGVDYFAVVGSIAQNAANDPICLAAIDDVGPANSDTNIGTHVFFSGNFAIANQNPACGTSDGEGIMFDTWDAHGYVGTGVIENNIIYDSSWAGLQIFQQSYNSSRVTNRVFNNTLFDNEACTQFKVGSTGEINIDVTGGFPWTIDIYNNIALTHRRTVGCSGGGAVYAYLVGGKTGTTVNTGGSGARNVFKGEQTTCTGSVCDRGDNVTAYNGFGIGTNIYENPRFANTANLLDDWTGTPNCSSYTNTTACMGWRYATQTAAPDSVIGDLTPTAPGISDKGYQPPGACAPNPYYPTWLKGIVYLRWYGSKLWEYNGLVQKPCGL